MLKSTIIIPAILLIAGIGLSFFISPYLSVTVTGIVMWAYFFVSAGQPPEHQDTSNRAQQQNTEANSFHATVNKECIDDLSNVLSTQTDAISTLSSSFIELQSLIQKQSTTIETLIHSEEDGELLYNEKMQDFAEKTGETLDRFIESTIETIRLFTDLVGDVSYDPMVFELPSTEQNLNDFNRRKVTEHNPISTSNMDAGNIDFF